MIRKVLLLLLVGGPLACASDYYVDCNYGSNGNSGTSPQMAWRTLLKVGISSFEPGDTINLLRDCMWNETLTPPSSGSSTAKIKIDSYGNGRPPHLTGYLAIDSQWWRQVGSTNVWYATLYSGTSGLSNVVQCGIRGFYCLTQAPSQLKYVRFGTVWGVGQASQVALGQDRDWWYDATNYILYVYSASGNPAAHYGNIAPIVLSGGTVLNLNNVSWLEIQHLQIDWFDAYGVQVQGASDHLWLANMVADSEVENGAAPLGFYVHPGATPVDIHLYNTDAHMNYAGYRFDGCTGGGCAFEIVNCRAYGNRAYGIMDNVQGAVSYDYCHLYANNLATAVTVDVSGTPGPTAGGHNIVAETPPWMREWRRWPAYTTVTYDDPGLVEDSDTYVNSLLPMMAAKEIPLSIAVVTGGSYSQSIIGEVQGWINAGWDINAHSISHEYWDPPAASCGANGSFPVPCHAFESFQYVGTKATTATLSVTHPSPGHATLTVTTSPDDPAADISWNLTPAAPGQAATGLDTLGGVLYTLQQRGVFSITLDSNAKSTARSISLADVTNLDIATAAQNLDLDETQMETEEMSWSLGWMNLNFTGLPANRVYVMPGTYGDPVTENIAAGLGYAGVRGTGSLKPCCGANTTLASGYDVLNILSQGMVPNYQGLSYQQLRNRVAQDVFKNALWGRPIGYFWHVNELRPDEVTNFMDALVQAGATLKSNTQMVNVLLACQANDAVPSGYVAGSYYVCAASGVEADFRPTVNSPVRDAGANLGAEYQYDLMGTNQNSFGTGWEMGAYVYVPENLSAMH
ncbi:MAG: right-handed parallel beta-helix repeat-containing protein [Acidobacteriia bacterium]|nr:right-handed parallel beta-helix repeat-containing protein [Terriglobia bacterium]